MTVGARSSAGGSLSTGFRPVANCNSFIVRSVSTMLEATWSTSLLMNSGSWRLMAISLSERILFSRRSISRPMNWQFSWALVRFASRLRLVSRLSCSAARTRCRRGSLSSAGSWPICFSKAVDVLLDLVGAGLLQELRQGVARIEQPQVNPQQTIQAGQLKLVQRHVDGAHAGTLQVHGDCRSSRHWARSDWKRCNASGGSEPRMYCIVCWLATEVSARWRLRLLGIDVALELGMAPQEADVGDLARQHDAAGGRRRWPLNKAGRRAAEKGQQVPVIQEGHFQVFAEMHANAPHQARHTSILPCFSRRVIRSRM